MAWDDLASGDDEDAAGCVFDEGLGERPAPPSRRPAVEMLVADHDHIGADLLRVARDLVHRVADEDLPAHRPAGLPQAPQAVLQHALVARLRLLPALGILDPTLPP